MMISPKMENPALAYQKIVIFKHTPLILLSHVRGIGVHWKTDARVVAIPKRITNVNRSLQMTRKGT